MRDLNLIRKLHGSLAAHVPGKKAQILTHWGGDADAVGSSYVLKRLLENIYTASDVGFIVPEDPSSHTAVIMRLLGLSEKLVADPDLYILVDVGSMNQLGPYRETVVESGKPVISIDHHLPIDAAETTLSIASTKYQATAEILYDLVDYLELDLSEGFAEALFLGMYYDTVRLSVADQELASKVGSLLQRVNPAEIVGMLEPKMDESERLARLKALKRISVYKLGDWYTATAQVNSYQSAVARVLVNAGAHVALVGGVQEGYTVISLRASPDFQKYAGLSLGDDLTRYLTKRFEGDGGGHAAAARVRLKTSVETALAESVKGLSTLLGVGVVEIQG
jgi:nanoRNase/pAp phosphatase (c-di-AMP/oligoRNAs hydrolase)